MGGFFICQENSTENREMIALEFIKDIFPQGPSFCHTRILNEPGGPADKEEQ
jgi:hypothetical protein